MGENQSIAGGFFGMFPVSPNNGNVVYAFNAALKRFGFSFVLAAPDASKVLNKILFYTSNVWGTLSVGDIVAELWSDGSSGQPNTSLESRATVSSVPTGGAWVEVTGFTATIQRGVRYWLVLKNANAAPATNYFSIMYCPNGSTPILVTSNSGTWGWSKIQSTDGGTTWGTAGGGFCGTRLEFSDGSFTGMPISSYGLMSGLVYAGRKVGAYFTAPANAQLSVAGLAHAIYKSGVPSVDVQFELYDGATLLATTDPIAKGSVSAGVWATAYFPSPVTLPKNSPVRAVLAEPANSDTATNYYRTYGYTLENSAASRSLMPFGGTLRKTYFDGTSWAETLTEIPLFALILNTSGDFAAQAGGGVSRGRVINAGGV